MEIYTQLFSTLSIDGRKLLVDLGKWAAYKLGPAQEDFMHDVGEIRKFNIQNNALTEEPIYSQDIVDSLGNKIQIGTRYIFKDQKLTHAKFDYWENLFANDPTVEYRPWVRES
jgi:hypothetical protein